MNFRLIFIVVCLIFSNCKEASVKKKENDVVGEYFELDNDNIKLFLPAYFERFSEEEYDKVISNLPDSEEKRIERKRFNYLKYSKGHIYFFKDLASSTLISVKMGSYLPFSKEESSQILGILSSSCNSYAELFDMNCEKITAGYSDTYKTKVFKAAYRLTDENDYSTYNTVYFISSNYKTFSIDIFSNTNKNYNSFIEKIVVK
ncbi:hypothetical protein [Psychroserpens algicola]|uniref:hypothetical protein n=1 Tax=Psychroserpens algicola TaxID=1719034 RepID=UPI0019537E43|nr:hypothetical protein [Psychroserpens algicola]